MNLVNIRTNKKRELQSDPIICSTILTEDNLKYDFSALYLSFLAKCIFL